MSLLVRMDYPDALRRFGAVELFELEARRSVLEEDHCHRRFIQGFHQGSYAKRRIPVTSWPDHVNMQAGLLGCSQKDSCFTK